MADAQIVGSYGITGKDYPSRLTSSSNQALIQATKTTSQMINCGGASPVALVIPQNFTPGNITFLASYDGLETSLVPVKSPDLSGNPYTIVASGAGHQPLDAGAFAGVKNLQVVCSTAQNNLVSLGLVMGPLWQ